MDKNYKQIRVLKIEADYYLNKLITRLNLLSIENDTTYTLSDTLKGWEDKFKVKPKKECKVCVNKLDICHTFKWFLNYGKDAFTISQWKEFEDQHAKELKGHWRC